MKNYLQTFLDIKNFFLKNYIIVLIFVCFLFPLTIGGRFAHYDFYFFIQVMVLIYFLIIFGYFKINFYFSIFTGIIFFIYIIQIYTQSLSSELWTGLSQALTQTHISLFIFCFLFSIIDFNKLKKKESERENYPSIHKQFFFNADKNIIISKNRFIKLILFFTYFIIFSTTLEPMQTLNDKIILNYRFRINFSDPNFSSYIGIFSLFVLSSKLPKYFFLISGLIVIFFTGSRTGLVLFLLFYILSSFPKLSFYRLFFFYFFILFFIYVSSWFLFDYIKTNTPDHSIVFSFLNKFCPVSNCRYFQAFIESGPLRIIDIFDISNFNRFNVIGANLHDLSKMNIFDYVLPMSRFDNVNSSFYSAHELILSLLPQVGFFLLFYFFFLLFFLIKNLYFFRIILFPIALASIFLGSQFLLLTPLIFLSFFYFFSVEKES